MKIIFLISLFFLSACSMYKSTGRKQLESDAPGKLQSFSLESCHQVDALKAWLQDEFPNKTYELVVSETNLEVLKYTDGQGAVEITATQSAPAPAATTSCLYKFADEATWRANKTQFVEDLENNMMTSD
jgi:hypothetical protein